MMFTHKNLMTVCCAAVLAFGLAACGSSSDDDNVAVTTPMMDGDGDADAMDGDGDAIDGDACDAGPSQACVDARQAELDAIEANDDATVGALNAAEMALGAAQAALSGANAADTVSDLIDDAVTATADIDDESTLAAVAAGRAAINAAQESLDGLVDGMENVSDDATAALQGRIDALDAGYSPIEMTVDTNADTAAAATKRTAIAAEARETGADDVFLPTGETMTTYSMTISRDRDGTTVKIADSANAMDDDPKFIDQDAGLDGGRTMHVRTMEPNDDGEVVEEVVIVATDIDVPKATPFEEVKNPEGEPTQALNANPETTGQVDFQSLTVGNNADTAPVEAQLALVKSADFVPGSGTITDLLTFARAQPATDGDPPVAAVAAFETEGTYNGAMGTYKCNATGSDDCTVTLDADGAITVMSLGWIFTPAEGATSDVADAEYLHYGFWLMRTTDADGVLTYNEVETFAGATGIPETADDDLSAVLGTADYKGGSVGVYVKDVLDDQANIGSSTSGHFSADVELTATFGGDNLPLNDHFTIGGKITDFVLQHGEANDWAVGLGLADFSGREEGMAPGESAPDDDDHTNTFNGVAIGDSTAVPGSWNGAFHGSSAVVDDDPATDDISPQPVAVVGEFNANFRDGTAAGGFGANKQ